MKKATLPPVIIGRKIIQIAEVEGLQKAFKAVWKYLDDGAKSSRKPFHYCSLATVENDIPQQRTMVAQKVIAGSGNVHKKIRFHTDSRSPKALHIFDNERLSKASCLFYEPVHKIQIRALGFINLASPSDIRDTWEHNMSNLSKRCYFSPVPPSSKLNKYIDFKINHEKMVDMFDTKDDISSSQSKYFNVLEFHVESLEFLVLGINGHVRALQHFERIVDNGDNVQILSSEHWLSP
jgi:hypothetical protein